MPPATNKRSATHTSRAHPYPKKDTASDMTSPVSPTTPRAAAGPWQPEDDAQLIEARKQSMNWANISQQHFPEKTANACRKRHERLMAKSHAHEDWDPTKLENMAVAYVAHRERMWKTLGDAIDENWKVVEIKCMEKGLKNLTNLGRSVGRRGKQSLPALNEDEDDSGFVDGHHPYSASPVAPSHSSRRTVSNTSSYAPTPLLQYTPLQGSQAQQQQQPYPQPHLQQAPFHFPQQHQQVIPSIASLLESTRGPNPNATATTN